MSDLAKSSHQVSTIVVALFFCGAMCAEALTLDKEITPHTPYDAYLESFRKIAAAPPGTGEFTLASMEKWTRAAHRIRYERVGDRPWQTPEQTERSATGDCKDKALWLYSRLREAGATALELVIGKQNLFDAELHAWVIARHADRNYLLDPTHCGSVWELSDFDWDEYVPFYSYDGNNAFCYRSLVRPSQTGD